MVIYHKRACMHAFITFSTRSTSYPQYGSQPRATLTTKRRKLFARIRAVPRQRIWAFGPVPHRARSGRWSRGRWRWSIRRITLKLQLALLFVEREAILVALCATRAHRQTQRQSLATCMSDTAATVSEPIGWDVQPRLTSASVALLGVASARRTSRSVSSSAR